MSQPLSQLCAGLDATLPAADPLISGVVLDSRRVGAGDLYVGLPGRAHHGAEFASQARDAGAAALLTDAAGAGLAAEVGLPIVQVADPRRAMATVAARCHGHPARRMLSFAVTGTNGKSTTVLLLASALASAGRLVASIGTLGFRLGDQALPLATSTVTTPEAPDLQAMLEVMVDRGADTMAMEVSSHALALHRVAGIRFDVAAFTNLGRDHLDFHASMADYFAAKAKLFTTEYARRVVLNVDDEAGVRLRSQASQLGLEAVGVGFDEAADYRIVEWTPEGTGSRFELRHPGGRLSARTALPGEYNVRNAATALAMVDQAGLDMAAALPGLATAVIPGRMEPVELAADNDQAPRVYVDFAHTPQAVASALGALTGPGRVVAVLGAGGDRDPEKRGPMGAAAVAGADVVVVTDDNPRSEDPAVIRAAVIAGAQAAQAAAAAGSRAATAQIIDGGGRRAAIRLALELAAAGDAVAILGKGHEKTQQLADQTIEFDDVQVAKHAWAQIEAGA